MGVRANFSPGDFQRNLEARIKIIEDEIVRRLIEVGEEAVNYARNKGDYQDQTGNLRSSIGYVIYKNGLKVYQSGFQQVKNGAEGPGKGRKLAEEKAREFGRGIVLVVVAGMNYAYYVETKGRDVLTGSEHQAKRNMKIILRKIKRAI